MVEMRVIRKPSQIPKTSEVSAHGRNARDPDPEAITNIQEPRISREERLAPIAHEPSREGLHTQEPRLMEGVDLKIATIAALRPTPIAPKRAAEKGGATAGFDPELRMKPR